jgi:fructan beta-fructosidase
LKKTISITGRYLWIPITPGAKDTIVSFYLKDEKIQEMCIEAGEEGPCFYTWFDAAAYQGSAMTLEGDYKERWFENVVVREERPCNPGKNRPLIHYAPAFGWLNDPNGLIYHKGVYHIYHQHNPYGVRWENMHWAHTSTPDFLSYTETEDVLFPDEEGPIFSGTAILDQNNCLGSGADAIAYFYTSAGGRSHWSKDHLFTQKMAVSTDHGVTLKKRKEIVLPHIKEENRDPKVFYHKESSSYIMVLYVFDDTFYFFRSKDLIKWEKIQEITVPGMWECPDFFPLTCEEDGVKKWVLWSADGYYCLGEFDGKCFLAQKNKEGKGFARYQLYDINRDGGNKVDRNFVRPYAAQTFQETGDRMLQLSWITSVKKDRNYAGMLSLPGELGLTASSDGYRICINPAKELEKLRSETFETVLETVEDQASGLSSVSLYSGEGQALEMELTFLDSRESCDTGASYIKLSVFETLFFIDLCSREITVGPHRIPLPEEREYHLRLYADTDVFELFVCGGLTYAVTENISDGVSGSAEIEHSGIRGSIQLHVLRGIRISE